MRTWLLVAAERREFDGLMKRLEASKKLDWPVEFAVESQFRGERWWMVANGPGREAVEQALESRVEVSGIVSTGFCGALDPALGIGDIVEHGLVCADRVAVTAGEKAELRAKTGAAAVDMESAAVAEKAAGVERTVPFGARCFRSRCGGHAARFQSVSRRARPVFPDPHCAGSRVTSIYRDSGAATSGPELPDRIRSFRGILCQPPTVVF